LNGRGRVTRSYRQNQQNTGGCQNVSDLRYAALKRYLAKRFHPNYAPDKASKRLFENEIFKESWGEIERLDQGISAPRSATGRSMMARGPCPKYKAG
jgi:hypothetical protein